MNTITILAGVFLILISCKSNDDQSDAFGNFETEETIISSEMAGKLIYFPVKLGDQVKQGDLLAVVDTTQASLQLKQLNAQQHAVATRRINVQAQVDVLKEQMDNLAVTRQRVHRLFADRAATQQQVDDADGQMRVLEKQLKSVMTQFVSINSEVEVIAAQFALAADHLRKCYIRTLTDGTVLEKYVEPGEVVSPAKAIVKLGDLSELDLRVYVSGAQLPSIRLGQQVEVLIDRDRKNNQALRGEVTWISSEAEFTPKIIQTKEERVKLVYAVKVRVKNDGRLKIGMPGEVRF
ncbi:MAG: HlyD family efflux transporter periplasmic adaptor subunit [Mangrovibacterium sp.]|nr:HlyD family efflux transporter periplasmic adaptor subunit [Mangrovibacterium sp.]